MPGLHVQLDVEYANDPKMIDAGPLAELLYVRGLCFAKRTMRDGRIARSQLPAIALGIPSPAKQAQRLVAVGAWISNGDGWQIAAWLKRNKSADRIAKDVAAKRLKSLMGNHERWHVKVNKYDPTCELCSPNGHPPGDPYRDPTPDSTEEEEEPEEETESQPEAEAEAEAQSSSSERGSPPGTAGHGCPDDDDPFAHAIELVVDAKVRAQCDRGKHIDNQHAYRTKVRTNTIAEDGALIRRMADDHDPPDQIAAFVLGHGLVSETERSTGIPWCGPDCTTCGGLAWTWVEEANGFAPCPDRKVMSA